ncbi:MAG: DUF1826 domain-containing protein [Bacteroidota bacterium]
MVSLQNVVDTDYKGIVHWAIDTDQEVLKRIHEEDVNIAIYERDTSKLKSEINSLLDQNIEFRASGDIDAIMSDVVKVVDQHTHSLIIKDMERLLSYFQEVVQTTNCRLLLAAINSNMCRKFHTDINEIRMLCTYSGPGTLWLTDDNINRRALGARGREDERIAIEESKVQQVKTGAVTLLKGALYPYDRANAVVHRSPTIEESGEKRLLLRVDNNDTSRLWA